MTKGTSLERHHLHEKRFASRLGVKEGDMLSIALKKDEHQIFTNKWRELIPYGSNYDVMDTDKIFDAARKVYADCPEILNALGL